MNTTRHEAPLENPHNNWSAFRREMELGDGQFFPPSTDDVRPRQLFAAVVRAQGGDPESAQQQVAEYASGQIYRDFEAADKKN